MVRIRTEGTRLTRNNLFEEFINVFQDCNTQRNIRTLERKKKRKKTSE